jgi:hypothetical protein
VPDDGSCEPKLVTLCGVTINVIYSFVCEREVYSLNIEHLKICGSTRYIVEMELFIHLDLIWCMIVQGFYVILLLT